MAEHLGDKTHDPTPHRRQQARREGHVARSQDLGSATLLLGGLAALWMLGRPLVTFLVNLAVRQLSGEPWLAADLSFALRSWNYTLGSLALVLLPILGTIALAGVAANLLQVGLQFQPGRAAPDLSRISPMGGLARLASFANLARLPVGIVKLLVVAGVAGYSLHARQDTIFGCGQLPVAELASVAAQLLLSTAAEIGGALLVLAGLDYAMARWKHERDLRMTTQELREEMKNLQGAPQRAARRRTAARHANQSAPLAAIAAADVIITQGERLAIALRYDATTMETPRVVAKGQGPVAAQMRRVAAEHQVPLVEREALARSLHQGAEVDRPIPRGTFTELAELLANVAPAAGTPS